jgi:uncharacterized protein (DUF885 family)
MAATMGTAVAASIAPALPPPWPPETAHIPAPPPTPVPPGRSAALYALLDEHVESMKRENPESASRRGDRRFDRYLRDESPEGYVRRLEWSRDRLARLRALDRASFSEADHLDADLLEYTLSLAIEGAAWHEEQMPIDSLSGPHVWLPQLGDQIPLRTEAHLADFAARLKIMGMQIDQQIAQMRRGVAAGRVPPRVVLARTLDGVEAQAREDFRHDPSASPFFRPFLRLPRDHPVAAEARAAIADSIVPAFQRLADFLRDEYIPACRETLSYSRGVDGPAAYAYRLRRETTLPLSPEQVHQIGLREVARLRTEMLACIALTDWPDKDAHLRGRAVGDLNEQESRAMFRAFLHYLRTDPRFYHASTETLLAHYRDICKRIDPELPRLFRTLPRNTYGVREIPRFAAPTSPAAYYYPGSLEGGQPGYFMVNTFALDQRPIYGMISLSIHEAVPGHHFQISLADELRSTGAGVHEFREWLSFTAFVEGWALYAERLGLEMGERPATLDVELNLVPGSGMGLYADPYDNFGRLSDEMWRACRLVVDTGLHGALPSGDWTRRQAIDFMLDHTAGTEVDLISEIDRYISWPGQACAYKIGELKIRELRTRARKQLGERFDLRAFHDAVLLGGALPMPVLEQRVQRWITECENGTK